MYLSCWVICTQLVPKSCVRERDLQVGPLKADFWCIGFILAPGGVEGKGGAEASEGLRCA
jgi:hypothetical protein